MPALQTALHTALFLLASLSHSPAAAQIYRCGNAYSHQPCPNATEVDTRATINTHTTPQKTTPKQSGSGKTHKADTASSANPRPAPSTRAHHSSRKNKHHSPNAKQKTCTQLAQRITEIDNRARQPNTASKQATLAQQRRNAHSRMFDLGCHKPHGY